MTEPTQVTPLRIHNPGNDTMHVTYDIGDGKTVTISVPYGRWIDGGHAPVGRAIGKLLDILKLQSERRAGRLPPSAD
jgi:hypothetical protein